MNRGGLRLDIENYKILDKYTRDELKDISFVLSFPCYRVSKELESDENLNYLNFIRLIKEKIEKIIIIDLYTYVNGKFGNFDGKFSNFDEIIDIVREKQIKEVTLTTYDISEEEFSKLVFFVHSTPSIEKFTILMLKIIDVGGSEQYEVAKKTYLKNISVDLLHDKFTRDLVSKYVYIEDLKNTLETLALNDSYTPLSKTIDVEEMRDCEYLERISKIVPKTLKLSGGNFIHVKLLEIAEGV